ncbi:MAG: SxtJ family membrane protein [Acidobacteriota bacterium]
MVARLRGREAEHRQARQFALLLAGLLCLLAAGSYFLGGHGRRAAFFLGGAGLVGGGAWLVFPLWLRLFRVWMVFGRAMGMVMSAIILTLFFYLLFSPVAIVMRWLGTEPLDLRWKDGKSSYWIDKAPVEQSLDRYRKQF